VHIVEGGGSDAELDNSNRRVQSKVDTEAHTTPG